MPTYKNFIPFSVFKLRNHVSIGFFDHVFFFSFLCFWPNYKFIKLTQNSLELTLVILFDQLSFQCQISSAFCVISETCSGQSFKSSNKLNWTLQLGQLDISSKPSKLIGMLWQESVSQLASSPCSYDKVCVQLSVTLPY